LRFSSPPSALRTSAGQLVARDCDGASCPAVGSGVIGWRMFQRVLVLCALSLMWCAMDAIDVFVDDVVSVRVMFPVNIIMEDSRAYSCYNLEVKGVVVM